MRRSLPILAIASTTAAADPCELVFGAAPDDVRTAIEARLVETMLCRAPIVIEATPSDAGLVLHVAIDGTVRQAVVADADAAVATLLRWLAEDRERHAPHTCHPGEPAPPRPIGVRAPARALAAGGAFVWDDALVAGVRLEVDVLRTRWFVMGIAGASTVVTHHDVRVRAGVALASARWELRTTVGAGARYTHGTGWAPALDAAATLARRLGATWAIATGPVVEVWHREPGWQLLVRREL